MDYHIRLTKSYSILEPFFRELQCSQLIVYEHHDAKRVHCHALLKGSSVKTTTMKARLTKLCGVWMKDDWIFTTSYKDKDEHKRPINDSLITYMSKGSLSPCFVSGFTENIISEYASKWVERVIKQTIKKPTYDKIIEETIAIAPFGVLSYDLIFANLITVLNKHKIICGRYKIRDMYDTIIRMQGPLHIRNDMSDMLKFPKNKNFD